MKKFAVVSAGAACVDIVANASEAFLREHGIPLDGGKRFSAAELKLIQSKLDSPRMIAGGATANSAAIVAALGGKAGFFGKVADDDEGRFFLEEFRRAGVEMCCPPYDRGGEATSVFLALVTGNDHRSFASSIGCAERYQPGDFRGFDFRATDFFLIESARLLSAESGPLLREAIHLAKGKARIVVNLQQVREWADHPEVARLVAEKADIIIGNETEQEIFNRIIPLPRTAGQIIVTTKGGDGAVARQGGQSWHTPAQRPQKFANTIGAGDGFIAGFLFSLSEGFDIEKSLGCGARVASAILGEDGGRPTSSLAHLSPKAGS